MRIKSIKFRLSTSKFKCNNCKKRLIGEDGFIHIECIDDGGVYNSGLNNIRICWDCFTTFCGEFEEDRKDRKERYLELTKQAIIRRLK